MSNINGRTPFAGHLTGKDCIILAPIALAYFAAHFIALSLPDAEKVLAAIWPPGGIGLAVLMLNRRRLWPAILAALFIAGNSANLLSGRPPILSIGFMTANVLESLSCAWLISRWCGDDVKFVRVKEVLALIAAAIFVNALTSFVGAGAAALTGKTKFFDFWLTWWIADGLGILLITPLIVTWSKQLKSLSDIRWERVFESGAFLAVWCVVGWSAFQVSSNDQPIGIYPYMPIALLAWPALRFGQRSVMLAIVLLAVIMLTSTSVTTGPLLWGGESLEVRLLLSQLYLGFMVFTGMLLAASHTESMSAEQSSREDQARVHALGDNIPNGMVYQIVREHDGSMRFIHVSAGVERLNCVSADEVLRDPSTLYGQILEEDLLMVAAAEDRSVKEMSLFSVEARFRRPDGQVRWMHLSSSPRRLEDGRILWDGVEMDITDRKQAEELIIRSLKEKESLLREIHHRVKNNMAVISSLLYLQAKEIEDDTVRGLLEESQQRIKSMALVHEKLYRTKDLSSVDFEDYITSLISDIISLYRTDNRIIATEINIKDVELDIETAVPCGLLINELLTNTYKHAFPDNQKGVVSVSFTRDDGTYTLIIKDNGVGLPEGLDYKNASTLGLQLVNVLAEQLGGTLQIKSDQGTEAIVTFKTRRDLSQGEYR